MRRWARIRRWRRQHGHIDETLDIHDLRFGDTTRPGSMSQMTDRRSHRREAMRRRHEKQQP